MINPMMRRAGLSVAVLAFFAIRAEAGAASAPVAANAPAKASAKVQGPRASAGDWAKVLAVAMTKDHLNVDSKTGESTYSVKDRQESPRGDVQKFEILVLVKIRKDKKLEAGPVLLSVAQINHLPENKASSEEWYFEVTPSGQLEKVAYERSIHGASIVDDAPMNLDLADPKTKALFDQTIAYWLQR